ncbi:SseB family protein [Methanobrevibacter sp.]|uniref:SseB family protein n=1 Tax=Methanobrevibacter sp. TaxID=66852 RepID=UPI00389118C1
MKIIDNSRLEEMIKDKNNPEVKREILDVLYDSRLLLPVKFRKCRNPDDLAGQFGFDVLDVPDGDGEKTVPLFTNKAIAESNPLKCTAIEIDMGDLAELMKQSDKYSSVTINIFTKHYLDLPLDEFLAIFGIVANHKIKDIENGKLRQILQNEFSEDELYSEIKDLPLISPWVDEESGPAHEFTYDKNDNEYFPLFTDLDEFEKVFGNDKNVYPQAYTFSRSAELTKDDMVINPASESVFLNRKDMLQER